MITIKGLIQSIHTNGTMEVYSVDLDALVSVHLRDSMVENLRKFWGKEVTMQVTYSSHGFDLHHGEVIVDDVKLASSETLKELLKTTKCDLRQDD